MAEPGEMVTVVDEHDNPIGTKLRADVTHNDIYRVTALWLTNSRGDVLLAQRGFHKKNNPGQWGPAVAGTVNAGESYEANIVKEVFEELGLQNIALTPLLKKFTDDGSWRYFCQFYTAVINRPANAFVIEVENIEQVAWFASAQLLTELQSNPTKFVPTAHLWPELLQGAESL